MSDKRVYASDDEPKQERGQYGKCGNYGSAKTIVIHHKSGANPDGTVVFEEVLCKECGKYTQYHFDDRV